MLTHIFFHAEESYSAQSFLMQKLFHTFIIIALLPPSLHYMRSFFTQEFCPKQRLSQLTLIHHFLGTILHNVQGQQRKKRILLLPSVGLTVLI